MLVAVGNNDEISAGEYDTKFIILQLCLRTRFLLRIDEIFTQGQGLMLLINDLYVTSKGIRSDFLRLGLRHFLLVHCCY